MQGESPYFFTWTKQNAAPRFSLKSAEGCWLKLSNGDRVLDLMSTTFQAGLGYSFTPVKKAMQEQLDALPLASPKAEFELKTRATNKLRQFLNFSEGKIFYTVSGAEAVENALKIVREVQGRNIILARKNSYHGATLGALSVTGDWRSEKHFSLGEWTVRIPEPHEDPDLVQTRAIIEKLGAQQIAAFCLETITGMNGVIIPPQTWWTGIQKLADEFGIALIVDEVTCGFGRTSQTFAFHDYNLRPDFVVMAKMISAGYVPFGALYVAQKFSRYYDESVLSCGLTNYAHPLGLAAMDVVIDTLQSIAFQKQRHEFAALFASELGALSGQAGVVSTRSCGLLGAIELYTPVEWSKLFSLGIHVGVKNNLLILAPALNMSPDDLRWGMVQIRKAIA